MTSQEDPTSPPFTTWNWRGTFKKFYKCCVVFPVFVSFRLLCVTAAQARMLFVTEEGKLELRKEEARERGYDQQGFQHFVVNEADTWSSFFFFRSYLAFEWLSVWWEVNMSAEMGEVAPNPEVMRLRDRSVSRLLDMARSGRPLVINFGSCT
ncbi:thyroxine 5-deiodinase-like [Homarus americanus]|uniref:thyroxine 5-deiodinase-like n=1 Tax=Homarus americanus TaxID=6706 RepID=UPI001C47ED35|nr:thyroxine 5-deiodinase-like [Homarus americanus]